MERGETREKKKAEGGREGGERGQTQHGAERKRGRYGALSDEEELKKLVD